MKILLNLIVCTPRCRSAPAFSRIPPPHSSFVLMLLGKKEESPRLARAIALSTSIIEVQIVTDQSLIVVGLRTFSRLLGRNNLR